MDSQLKSLAYKLVRNGFRFKKILKELETSQYYSPEQLEEIQNRKLRRMIDHCYRHVPYYNELFQNLHLTPEQIRTKEDLCKLPLMDKQTVRKNFDKLIARNIPRIFSTMAETSGTTGTPTQFLRDYSSVNFEHAAVRRFKSWTGCKGCRQVTLRGDMVVPVTRKEPPFWKYYPMNDELILSSYHLTMDHARTYLKKIREFKPDILFGFPSSTYQLAKNLAELGQKIELGAVITSSEMLSEKQRNKIEEIFRCRVYDWYGQVERVSAIGQCEQGAYHIIEDYSITETVPTESGIEIVGTNLNNYIMPLIRYRTSDVIELGAGECSCGRHFRRISKIHGRAVNYILSPEGNKISLFLVSDSIDFVNNINEVQFVQEKKGELILNIVGNSLYSQRDEQNIIRIIKEHTSPDMSVVVKMVDEIPRGPNGKVIDLIVNLE